MTKGGYVSWKKFPRKVVSYSWAKSGERLQDGVCIGCGKQPCACKGQRKPRRGAKLKA